MVVWLLRLLLRLLLLLLLTLLLLLQQLLLLLSKVGATPVRACLLLVLVSSPLFRHASAPVVPHTVVTPARPKWCACVSVHVSARVLAYVCVCMCVCACKMSSMKHAQFKPPTSFAVLHVAPNISTLPSALAALCTQFCYVLPCCTLLMHCNASTQRPCYAHYSCITMPLHKGPDMHTPPRKVTCASRSKASGAKPYLHLPADTRRWLVHLSPPIQLHLPAPSPMSTWAAVVRIRGNAR